MENTAKTLEMGLRCITKAENATSCHIPVPEAGDSVKGVIWSSNSSTSGSVKVTGLVQVIS